MKDLVFVDVETTGLSPQEDSILQVAVIRTDHTGENVKATLNIKVKPTTPVHPQAAAVNGYTPQAWEDATDPSVAAEQLTAMCQGAEFAAHCVWFDQGFCEALLKRHGYKIPWGRRLVDTQTLAHLMWESYGDMGGTSLQACISALGGTRGTVHDAYDDAEWARKVYVWAVQRVKVLPAA